MTLRPIFVEVMPTFDSIAAHNTRMASCGSATSIGPLTCAVLAEYVYFFESNRSREAILSQVPPFPGSNIVIMPESPEPNFVLRVLWFLFLGWWLSFGAIVVAALLQLTIIGIPGGIWVINRLPQIMTLKSSKKLQVTENQGGVTVVSYGDREQLKWWIRAIYYLLVGCWATILWLFLVWVMGVLIITLPISFWMVGQTGKIQTLRR